LCCLPEVPRSTTQVPKFSQIPNNLDLPEVPRPTTQVPKSSHISDNLDLPHVPKLSPRDQTANDEDSFFQELNQRFLGLNPQNSTKIDNFSFGFPSVYNEDNSNDLDLPSVPKYNTTNDDVDLNNMDLPSPPLGFTRSVVAYSFKPDLLKPVNKEENPDEDELFSRFSQLKK